MRDYTTAVTTVSTKTVLKVGAGKLYGITNNTPQPGKTLRVYDGQQLWFTKDLSTPFEMYKPLKYQEYEEFRDGLTVEPDGREEILYFYA